MELGIQHGPNNRFQGRPRFAGPPLNLGVRWHDGNAMSDNILRVHDSGNSPEASVDGRSRISRDTPSAHSVSG